MRILVIEDFQMLRDSLTEGLREEGFAVDAASDGKQGLWQANSGGYDVIVLDLMLPGMDGLSVLRKLREANHPARVLILTARDTLEDKVKGLDQGADDYLVKPFAFTELLARVKALVRRRYDARSPTIAVGDMMINTAAKSVTRGGKMIDLSAREYALLEFLALRAGEVVSRTDIWEHVYDFNSTAESNVVDVFIGHLRRKIERNDLPKLIHTRRGQGYVLAEATS